MSIANPSAILAESLSNFSKAAYQAFSEVEAQAHIEVARSVAEAREAIVERDNALKELHSSQLEVQSWRQEAGTSKAALGQAELTIAHQAETLALQSETIAQLRREVTQWKDQSRNWQEHFLRVEQERCAQTSRIDELVMEKLQYPSSRQAALFTPEVSKYGGGINSAPSTTSGRQPHSPTQPPPYNPASLSSPADLGPIVDVSTPQGPTNLQKKNSKIANSQKAAPSQSGREIPSVHAIGESGPDTSSPPKRPRKSNPTATIGQKSDHATQSTMRPTTIIRRVQAVVQVKHEEDSEDESPVPPPSARRPSISIKKKEESVDQQRYLRTPRSKIIPDDDVDEDEVEKGNSSMSDMEHGQRRLREISKKNRSRRRSRVNYREEEDDEEEDELMLGAEENHEEVYGTHPVQPQDSRAMKQAASGPHPQPKRRRLAPR